MYLWIKNKTLKCKKDRKKNLHIIKTSLKKLVWWNEYLFDESWHAIDKKIDNANRNIR